MSENVYFPYLSAVLLCERSKRDRGNRILKQDGDTGVFREEIRHKLLTEILTLESLHYYLSARYSVKSRFAVSR